MNQISRYGAYGILVQDSKILLAQKKSGPYKGRWGLPGGGIEFGEAPESALKRELLEEIAMEATQFELFSVATALSEYEKNGESYQFHHIGIIYRVFNWVLIPDLIPEEEGRWMELQGINQEELTPFAKHILTNNFQKIGSSGCEA